MLGKTQSTYGTPQQHLKKRLKTALLDAQFVVTGKSVALFLLVAVGLLCLYLYVESGHERIDANKHITLPDEKLTNDRSAFETAQRNGENVQEILKKFEEEIDDAFKQMHAEEENERFHVQNALDPEKSGKKDDHKELFRNWTSDLKKKLKKVVGDIQANAHTAEATDSLSSSHQKPVDALDVEANRLSQERKSFGALSGSEKIQQLRKKLALAVEKRKSAGTVGNNDAETKKMDAPESKEQYGTRNYFVEQAEKLKSVTSATERQEHVRDAFLHGWNNYVRFAWGKDELKPISKRGKDWLGGAAMIIDSLDTLFIMELMDEFHKAREYVAEHVDYSHVGSVSFFETTIRHLGGLLSAYDLSGDKMFLNKAEDVGKRLLKAFQGDNVAPVGSINLRSGFGSNPGWTGGKTILAEATTIQLEFTYLALATGKEEYAFKALEVMQAIQQSPTLKDFMAPIYLTKDTLQFSGPVTMGAMGDSYFEYLLKMWLFTGGQAEGFRKMFDATYRGVDKNMKQYTSPSRFVYLAEVNASLRAPKKKMDHLACFAGGMYALGSASARPSSSANLSFKQAGVNPGEFDYAQQMELGKDVTNTCHETYRRTKTGLAPEFSVFPEGKDIEVPSSATWYLLRPETVESYFVLWRTTHDQKYRDWGWEAFMAIEKYCKVKYGYSGIRDVRDADNVRYDDTMQTFLLAETLKYLYLLFSPDDLIPLDKFVFNTEAHVLSIQSADLSLWPKEIVSRFPQ